MLPRLSAPRPAFGAALALAALVSLGAATPIAPDLLAGLHWRNVGPFRGGRVAAVTGAVGPTQAGVFYAGYPSAGVWKTVNAGITWTPIFDAIKSSPSVGAVEVAPSDPNVIYVGMGDMITGGAINEGDGVYKSTDAGQTWQHLGLDATKQIPSILVDPKDPNLVMIAAQGNVHTRNSDRGVYRSTDGGKTWTKTLFVDDTTGIQKIARAYDQPSVIFATTVKHYAQPGPPQLNAGGGFGGNRQRPDAPSNTRIFKSTDEGLTWHEITGGGLPRLDGRTSIAVAMNTNAQRVYLVGNFGLWRSDDGGTTWRQMDADDRRVGNGQGGYNCGVYVDPQNPDIVYTINTSSYVSRDGGNTFTGFKGAPGGDDPQQLWIDPTNGQRVFLGMDQGATVSLDGGKTWSPWYNQSTDQVYHVSVDNSTPYWIYGAQQDAGAIRTRDRGNFGEITPLDWSPVGTWEWGTVVADPLNPNIVYGSGSGILKITYPSEQIINVSPNMDPGQHLRTSFSMPMVWAPWNQHELLAGFQFVMSTVDGGVHWTKLSPDLGYAKGVKIPTDSEAALPPRPGAPRGGAIESMSASTVAPGIIWVGTSNGLVKMTRDNGKTWSDVSIPDTPDSTFATISSVDASHTAAGEAYVAVDVHRLGDYAPHLYRTRDYGKSWTAINNGLATDEPSGSFTRFVRSDTKKAGLLFAGTESGMYVSFNDGDDWQSLQLNLPNTSFRDGVIKGNDLVVGTYGRGFWVLDDISPLRQMAEGIGSEAVHLFRPGDATRYHRNVNQDTPYPPEVTHADNPPEGAIIYYYLANRPSGDISLDVMDATGKVVRHMSSAPITPVEEAAKPPHPNFWVATPEPMSTDVGTNRTNWDLRADAPKAFRHSYEINANPGLTPASPEGPVVAPGTYTLKLTVDGKSYTQPVTVKNDPRSPATGLDIAAQYGLQSKIVGGLNETWDGYQQVSAMRGAIDTLLKGKPSDSITTAAKALDAKLEAVGGNLNGGGGRRGGGRGGPAVPDFVNLNGTFARLLNGLDLADMAPTPAMTGAWGAACVDLNKALDSLKATSGDLKSLNMMLGAAHLTTIAAPSGTLSAAACPATAKGRSRAQRARANAEEENDDPDNPDAVLNGGGTDDGSD